jgi:tRNA pseudouridine38-40 synthase
VFRYFLELSYNGKNFNGWQTQLNTVETIQQVLEEKMSLLLKEPIGVVGCGRTDTGVHARYYVLHFDCTTADLHLQKGVSFLFKLNHMLPQSIAIFTIKPVVSNANARFNAFERTYKYYIHQNKNAFKYETSWELYGPIDVDLMNEAAAILLETSDFKCFSKVSPQTKTSICKVTHAQWEKNEDDLIFTITANRFLRNMVRAIVGTLIEVGQKKITLDDFKAIIESRDRNKAGKSVPARGLFLEDIKYSQKIFLPNGE